MFDYFSTVISITDGDSAHIEISLGLNIYHRTNCRLYGINTPELNSADPVQRTRAQAAKARLTELIEGKKTLVYSHALDKYGRPLVTIFLNGENINQRMIDEGYAIVMKGIANLQQVFYVYGNSKFYHSDKHFDSEASVYLKEHLGDKVPCEECLENGWLKQ